MADLTTKKLSFDADADETQSGPWDRYNADKIDIPITGNVYAPDIYATGAPHFAVIHGNISITLTSRRSDTSLIPAQLIDVEIGRLVMSPDGAKELAAKLARFLSRDSHHAMAMPLNKTEIQ